ncbi:MAG: CBS domain-containing protein [Ktedonobacteraceae bacterium]|nr:CBS domain-containing protein [Ktedonobacteraceae bacterium]
MKDAESEKRLTESIVRPDVAISEAMAQLERAGTGALLLCDADRRLRGLLTDGDIRRAVLQGRSLSDACDTIATLGPISVPAPVSAEEALRVMNEHDIHHLPALDADGRVQIFILRQDLTVESDLNRIERRLKASIISPDASISEAMAQLDKAATGTLLVCDSERHLLGLLTDGDFRRAILRRKPMSEPCGTIASSHPITAPFPILPAAALQLMNEHDVSQLPVVNSDGQVQSLLLRKDIVPDSGLGLSAVVMAGGLGTRLLPLTEKLPKPMLPVGDRPLLELTIAQLRRAGIKDVNLTTHYLSEAISDHFKNGETFGVRLNYLQEEHPLGTAGGLKSLKHFDGTMLVINGDVLTGVPFDAMLDFHRAYHADLTIGVRKYDVQVPFGVVKCEDVHVTQLQEKPSLGFFINAGTYLIEPAVCEYIPAGERFDMTELIQKLIEAGKVVVSFPIMEYWLDMGRHEDYLKAQEDFRGGVI